jgi:hypothetical protein
MEFLVSRGHGRLVISTDIETFPEAVLNGKRLDIYNLYKEVWLCLKSIFCKFRFFLKAILLL